MPDYLRLIDDSAPPRADVTPLFADAVAFEELVHDLARRFPTDAFDIVAGIDALGFILGGALAHHFAKGFIAVRKTGKLPHAAVRTEFVDYSGEAKGLELRPDLLRPGMRVLLVDEWIETGSQVQAAIRLIEGQGAKIVGIAAIQADRDERTHPLFERYNLQTAWP